MQNLPILADFGLFRQFPPHKRLFSEILICNLLMTYKMLEQNWKRFG